jgi:hypothetical protein
VFKGGQELFGRAVIEAELAFLEEEVEVVAWDAVEAAQMTLGLVPEVLDAVDVVVPVGKALAVIDTVVLEAGDVDGVVGSPTVGVDDGVGQDLGAHDRQERLAGSVGDHLGVHFAATLENAKDRNLPGSASTPFAFAHATEVTLVHFKLADFREHFLQPIGNHLAHLPIKQHRRIALNPNQIRCRPSGRSHHEALQELLLYPLV